MGVQPCFNPITRCAGTEKEKRDLRPIKNGEKNKAGCTKSRKAKDCSSSKANRESEKASVQQQLGIACFLECSKR